VFAGGCTPSAVAEVCEAGRTELSSLVANSLLYERPGRFLMLETVREYALEKLEEGGEADAVRRRHAEHFAALAETAADESSALEQEHDNLRAAIDWSHEAGAVDLELRLAAALAVFWSVRNHLREGQERVEAALRHAPDGPAPVRAKALGGGSWIALRLGDYERAEQLAEESLDLYRMLGDEPGIALALNRLGAAMSNRGDIERAMALQKESAAVYHRLGDERGVAVVLSNLGYRLVIQGDYEQARFLCDEALSLFRKLDERASMPLPLINLGLAALMQERHEEALAYFRAALQLAREVGSVVMLVHALDGLAAALAGTGGTETATILGAAEAAVESSGVSLEPLEQEIHDRTAEAVDGFGPARGRPAAPSRRGRRLGTALR
jgi:tetratricopeptide (TPR) repeat protein